MSASLPPKVWDVTSSPCPPTSARVKRYVVNLRYDSSGYISQICAFSGVKVGGREGGVISRTVGGMDADAERTWMYSQRVQEMTPPSWSVAAIVFLRANQTMK